MGPENRKCARKWLTDPTLTRFGLQRLARTDTSTFTRFYSRKNTHTNINAHTLTVEEALEIQTSCRRLPSPLEREAEKKFARDRLYDLKRSTQMIFKKFTIELCV